MTEVLERCRVCLALIDEEDLFCANCGCEAPDRRTNTVASATLVSTHNFDCQGCGASMSYDASAQNLRCPFCGSEKLDGRDDCKTLAPQRVVPFVVDRDGAVAAMRGWLKQGFWRPSDLSDAAIVTSMTAVYVPYWVFCSQAFAFWTADSSATPAGARASWYPVTGEHRGDYRHMLVGASGALTPAETAAICPFDLALAVAPDQVDLANIVFEPFRVQRKYARTQARAGFDDLIRRDCLQYVAGRSRNLKVNAKLEGLTSEAVLLPVWIMAYRYDDKVFRFLLNGQTGKSTGTAPTSVGKVALAVGLAVAGIVLVIILIGLLSR